MTKTLTLKMEEEERIGRHGKGAGALRKKPILDSSGPSPASCCQSAQPRCSSLLLPLRQVKGQASRGKLKHREGGLDEEKRSDSDCRSRFPSSIRALKASAGFVILGAIFGFFFGIVFSWASPTAFLFPRLLAHVILGPLTSNLDDSWLKCLFHHLSQPKSRIYVFFTPPRDPKPW